WGNKAQIRLNSWDYESNYDNSMVTLDKIYLSATRDSFPTTIGSAYTESQLESGVTFSSIGAPDDGHTVYINVTVQWEGQPLDFEVQFDDPDVKDMDVTLTASVDFGTPLPDALTSTFFSGHGM